MNLYQRNPQEYLNMISEKLDRLNLANPRSQNQIHDPGFMDPMEWQGRAAIEHMKKQRGHGF